MKIDTCVLVVAFFALTFISILVKRVMNPQTSCGSVLLEVSFGFLQSIMASIVFYILIVHLPEQNKKHDLAPYIKMRSMNIVGDAEGLYGELAKAANSSVKFEEAKEEDIKIISERVHFFGKAPMIINTQQPFIHASWLWFMVEREQRSKRFIEDLFKYMPYLESEHVKLLTEINSDSYFMELEIHFSAAPVRASNEKNIGIDFSILSKSLYEYFLKARALRQYTEANFK